MDVAADLSHQFRSNREGYIVPGRRVVAIVDSVVIVVKVTFRGRLIVYSRGVCRRAFRGTANRYDCSEAIPHDGRRGRQGTVSTVWSVRWDLREVGVSSEYLFSDRLSKVNESLVYRGLLCIGSTSVPRVHPR